LRYISLLLFYIIRLLLTVHTEAIQHDGWIALGSPGRSRFGDRLSFWVDFVKSGGNAYSILFVWELRNALDLRHIFGTNFTPRRTAAQKQSAVAYRKLIFWDLVATMDVAFKWLVDRRLPPSIDDKFPEDWKNAVTDYTGIPHREPVKSATSDMVLDNFPCRNKISKRSPTNRKSALPIDPTDDQEAAQPNKRDLPDDDEELAPDRKRRHY
jgi:hypothetical protein